MNVKWNASLIATGDAFRVEAELGPGSITVRPFGLINEDVNFGAVLEFIDTLATRPKEVRFDMSGVTRINSCGIREWLLFLQRIQGRYACAFVRANEVFVEVAASVPTVFGRAGTPLGEIEVPYFCSKCNKRRIFNLKARDCYQDGAVAVPEKSCPSCASTLELDGLEAEYFNFLKHVMS